MAKTTRSSGTRSGSASGRAGARGNSSPSAADRRAAALVGTWGPEEHGDSNVHFTVTRHGKTLAVTARDVYDGEVLRVQRIAWDGKVLRFETLTPSTGSTMSHELESTSASTASYRFTTSQAWRKLDAPS